MIRSDIETLLREDAWMRRIARGLLRDPHDAEDAVQDAWVADLEGAAPAKAERRRGWLRGVLWNRASARTRTERRLRERAEDAARGAPAPEAPPAGHDAEARDLRRAIAEAVLELDEPLRETVHLTYFAGLSLAEVAARTDVSKTAAHKRLDRALGELRRRLDAQHGGDRRAWSLGLATFLGIDAPPLAATVSPPEPEPRLAMRTPEILAAAAVAVTAVASFSFLRGSPGPVAPAPTRNAPGAGSALPTVAAASSAAARTAPPTATAQVAEVDPEATIRGRFLLPDGSPAGGCEWTLSGSRRGLMPGQQLGPQVEWESLSGVTDADGRLAIEFVPPPTCSFTLRVEREGFAGERWSFAEVRRGSRADLGTFILRPESGLTVRLVDDQGHPVAQGEARVQVAGERHSSYTERVSLRRHVTIEDGVASATAAGLAAGDYELSVYGPGPDDEFECAVSLAEGVTREVDVTVASAGVPVSSSSPETVVVVFREHHSFQWSASPDAEFIEVVDGTGATLDVHTSQTGFGPVRIHGPFVPPLTISVNDPRFEPWSREGIDGAERVDARLFGTGAVRLDVVDPSGQEVNEYSVLVGKRRTTEAPTRELRSGPGRPPGGVIDGLTAGEPFRIKVTTPELAATVDVDGPLAGAVTDVVIPLQPRLAVSGRVVREDGTPAAFVDVLLVRPAEVDDSPQSTLVRGIPLDRVPPRSRIAMAESQTDGQGRYGLEAPGPGDYLVAAVEGVGVIDWSDEFDMSGPVAGIDLELGRVATLRGRLELPSGIDPRHLLVLPRTAAPSAARGRIVTTVDSLGCFELRGLTPGMVEVYVQVERSWLGRVAELPPVCAVELEPGEIRDVGLLDGAGVPGLLHWSITGLPATCGDPEFYLARLDAEQHIQMATTVPGSVIANELGPVALEAGPWRLFAFGDDWALGTAIDVVVEPGETRAIETEANLIRREVKLEVAGAPVEADSARFLLQTSEPTFPMTVPVRSGGVLDAAMGPGEYVIRVQIEDGPAGAPASVTAPLTWPPEPGTVVELQ